MSRAGGTGRPRRGRPPRIDRAAIVAAARDMDPDDLTMQAVAERLGVDRKALNYHVGDREGLLRLVAAEAIGEALARIDVPVDAPWPDALRTLATGMRDAIVSTGALAPYLPATMLGGPAALVPVERFLAAMLRAGFEPEEAGRVLTLVAEVVHSSARDVLFTQGGEVHPQTVEVAALLLAEEAAAELPILSQMVRASIAEAQVGWPADQLPYDLDVIVAGVRARLDRRAP